MINLILRLYPARWRARYGDEFAAVLEERSLGPFDVADVLLGALDAHLHLRGLGAASQHGKGFTMSLRIGGYAAILGAALIGLGIVLTGGLTEGSDDAAAILLLVGLAALLVGLAGMSAYQARSDPWLVWGAFAMTAVGTVVTFVAGVSDLAGVWPRRLAGWPAPYRPDHRGPWVDAVRGRDVPRVRAVAHGGTGPGDQARWPRSSASSPSARTPGNSDYPSSSSGSSASWPVG